MIQTRIFNLLNNNKIIPKLNIKNAPTTRKTDHIPPNLLNRNHLLFKLQASYYLLIFQNRELIFSVNRTAKNDHFVAIFQAKIQHFISIFKFCIQNLLFPIFQINNQNLVFFIKISLIIY